MGNNLRKHSLKMHTTPATLLGYFTYESCKKKKDYWFLSLFLPKQRNHLRGTISNTCPYNSCEQEISHLKTKNQADFQRKSVFMRIACHISFHCLKWWIFNGCRVASEFSYVIAALLWAIWLKIKYRQIKYQLAFRQEEAKISKLQMPWHTCISKVAYDIAHSHFQQRLF